MESVLIGTLITIALFAVGLTWAVLANRPPGCGCGVPWVELNHINVFNYDRGYIESVIFIRQCPNCKLIHQQKVSN